MNKILKKPKLKLYKHDKLPQALIIQIKYIIVWIWDYKVLEYKGFPHFIH
jgi:hypothetical protein